ncbi:MAG: hypothetical protein ACRYG7_14120 [Janthinobacterium lividum]
MTPYDDPHVSAGEIADYLHSLQPQLMPHFPTTLKESSAKHLDHAQNLELAAACAELAYSKNDYPVYERGFIARLVGDGTTNSLLSSPYKNERARKVWQEGWMMADEVLKEPVEANG